VAKARLEWQRDGADWPNRSASRFVRSGGLDWHVQVAGSGPALLMLHGTGASTHSWRGLLPHLCAHYTVVAPDLPGHGFTDLPADRDLSLSGMSAGIARLLLDLNLAPQLGIGHSAGAAILARMSLDHRVALAHIVSLNGAFVPLFGSAGLVMPALARVVAHVPFLPDVLAWRGEDRRAVERLLASTGSHIDEEGLALYQRLFASRQHVAGAIGMMAQWDLPGLWRDLPRLETRLTLIAASGDLTIPATQAYEVEKRVGSHSSVRLVRGLGHLAHEEDPPRLAQEIRAALSEAP
jgi:magnesium chelatase accessory protein